MPVRIIDPHPGPTPGGAISWRELLERLAQELQTLQTPMSLGRDEDGNEMVFTERDKREILENVREMLGGRIPRHILPSGRASFESLVKQVRAEAAPPRRGAAER